MKCLVAVDAIHPNNNPEYLNLGFEYSAMDMFFLRIGKSHTFYELKYNGENGRGSNKVFHLEEAFGIVFLEVQCLR